MNEFLELAKKMANESSCLRVKYGCVIVKDEQILSTGWNAPLDKKTICKKCSRIGKKHGEGYDSKCISLHAEEWAIVHAISNWNAEKLVGATIFISGIGMPKGAKCCWHCSRLLKAIGIKEVIIDGE